MQLKYKNSDFLKNGRREKFLNYCDSYLTVIKIIQCSTLQGLVHPDQLIHRQLLNGLRDPVAVAVHPWRGFLFFAEAQRPAKIYRCSIGSIYSNNLTLNKFTFAITLCFSHYTLASCGVYCIVYRICLKRLLL